MLRGRGASGSGTAIGVAVLFPALVLVIVSLQALTESSRIEQALQSTAARAARIAALCCHYTDGAAAAATAALAAAEDAGSSNHVLCNNDFVGDSSVLFENVAGQDVRIAADSPVPPGGTVYVVVTCRLRPQDFGVLGFPGLHVERRAVGVASVDPYRARSGG